jgi:hypothetical protein
VEVHEDPQTKQIRGLVELVDLTRRLAQLHEPPYRIRRGAYGPELAPGKGIRLLDALTQTRGVRGLAVFGMKFHPHVVLLDKHARSAGLESLATEQLALSIANFPDYAAAKLNQMAAHVRHLCSTAQHVKQVLQEESRARSNYGECLSYFKSVRAANPGARISRLELFLTQRQEYDGVKTATNLVSQFMSWLQAVAAAFGPLYAADSWQVDCDLNRGLFVHVLLGWKEASTAEIAYVERKAMELWREQAPLAAWAINMKHSHAPLLYRGAHFAQPVDAVPLREEFRRCAVYFTRSAALYRIEFGDAVPTSGRNTIGDASFWAPRQNAHQVLHWQRPAGVLRGSAW